MAHSPSSLPPDAAPLQPIIKRSLSPSSAISNSALKSPQFSPPGHPGHSPTSPSPPPGYFGQVHATAGGGAGATKDAPLASSSSLAPTAQTPGSAPYVPPTPGILLNKNDSTQSTIRDRAHSPPVGVDPHWSAAGAPLSLSTEALLRVASPEGGHSSTRSDSGFSSGGDNGGASSPTPSSTLFGSPTLGGPAAAAAAAASSATKPTLDSLVTSSTDPNAIKRATSPPSPHCHFAPLPKPEERPQSRRSSIVGGRVKPYVPRPPERSDTMSTAAGGDDDALASGEYTPGNLSPPVPGGPFFNTSTSSAEHFSALSQRLSSSLTFAAPSARHPSSPSRPTSRRSSSSRRSRSPSPPGFSGFRSNSSAGASMVSEGGGRTVSSSRTHSPNLSRRPSTDALSLHYIEAGAEGGRGGANLSRQSSKAGSERGGPAAGTGVGGGDGDVLSMGSGIRRPRSTERRSTFEIGPKASTPIVPPASSSSVGSTTASSTQTPGSVSPTSTSTLKTAAGERPMIERSGGALGVGTGLMMVDRDKEADLHRLVEKAQHGNLDAERAVSPALHSLHAQRERVESAEREREQRERERDGGHRDLERSKQDKGDEVEVVAIGKGNDREEVEELEEVKEEDEEDVDDDDEDEDGNDDDEDEDGDGDDDDEGNEDDEPDRSREEDDDDDDEEEEMEERKTSKGAAVEVVRWHRDDPPPAPHASSVPTPSIPEDAVAEAEAEEENELERKASSQPVHASS
ncbi:hypothetical protein JCM10212_004785 [Sporobolomyces blumeae]